MYALKGESPKETSGAFCSLADYKTESSPSDHGVELNAAADNRVPDHVRPVR